MIFDFDPTELTEGESDLIWHTVIRSDLTDTQRRDMLDSTIERIMVLRLRAATGTHAAREPHPATMIGRS